MKFLIIISIFSLIVGSEAISVYLNANLLTRYDQTTIKLEPTTTIREVKKFCANKYGIQDKNLIIKNAVGDYLSEDSTLESNNINNWGVLRLAELKDSDSSLAGSHDQIDKIIRIGIRSTAGWSTTLEVKSNETVKDLKELIEHAEGIPVDMQKLYLGNEKLEDDSKLKDYNIDNDSVIHLILV